MATIAQLLHQPTITNSDTAKLDAEVLLCHVLNKPRSYLYTWPEKELDESQHTTFLDLLKRREQGEPIAYITGIREFWSLPLSVNNSTLIPRPDTELLVELALQKGIELSKQKGQSLRVLDLGTGTGAIAIAIASEQPNWQITACDKFSQACELASSNCEKLNITNIKVMQSDWFSDVEGKFDLIVSNPPYIDKTDPHLAQGDVAHEPLSALIAEGNGFSDIALIIEEASNYLNKNGWLMIEHGFEQAEKTAALFEQARFRHISVAQDLVGNDRVSIGQRS